MKDKFNSTKNDGKIREIGDIFNDSSLRVIGIVGNTNEAKSNTIYHMIDLFKTKYETPKIYSNGLRVDVEGVQHIGRIAELELISNSIVIMDEFTSFLHLSNRKAKEAAEDTLRTVHHSNNILILSGVPHNYDKFISGLLQVTIFKQSNLEDFIQRSSLQQFTASYNGGFNVSKGQSILKMDKETALVWLNGGFCYEVDVPYVKWGDTKQSNKPVLIEKINKK